MLLKTSTLLAFISAAAAVLQPRDENNWPSRHLSRSFWLMVNVTDLSRDFDPPVHQNYVTGVYLDHQRNVAAVNTDRRFYAIFSQWGTNHDMAKYRTRLFGHLGTATNYAFQLKPDEGDNSSTVMLNADGHTNTIQISRNPVPVSFVDLTHLAVCMEPLPDSDCVCDRKYPVIKRFKVATDRDIPEKCAPIRLLPHCAATAIEEEHFSFVAPGAAPKKGEEPEEKTHRTSCYKNIAKIKWNRFSDFQTDS